MIVVMLSVFLVVNFGGCTDGRLKLPEDSRVLSCQTLLQSPRLLGLLGVVKRAYHFTAEVHTVGNFSLQQDKASMHNSDQVSFLNRSPALNYCKHRQD